MPFQITATQLAELQTLRDTFPAPTSGNTLDYAVLYDKVLEFVDLYAQTNTLSESEMESALWIAGAATVNRDTGAQSDFIRDYNNAQSQLRYRTSVTDAQMDQVSDEIVLTVIDQILNGDTNTVPPVAIGTLPTIKNIADSDAEPAAQSIFNNEEEPGGWAGNPLFLFLDYDQAYQDNILKTSGDTYDLLAMMKVIKDIAGEVSLTDLKSLVVDSVTTAYTVNAGAEIANAIALSETFLEDAYGDSFFPFGNLLVATLADIKIGSIYSDDGADRIITEDPTNPSPTSGDEIVHAGLGDDLIMGSAGDDLIDGGEGTDTLSYLPLTFGVEIEEQTFSGAQYNSRLYVEDDAFLSSMVDYVYGIEKLILTTHDDEIELKTNTIKELDTGAGEDKVNGTGLGTIVDLGADNDEIKNAGSGTVITTGSGEVWNQYELRQIM